MSIEGSVDKMSDVLCNLAWKLHNFFFFLLTEKGKIFKIASKLNPRKKSGGGGKYKLVQEKYGGSDASDHYQPLIDGNYHVIGCV